MMSKADTLYGNLAAARLLSIGVHAILKYVVCDSFSAIQFFTFRNPNFALTKYLFELELKLRNHFSAVGRHLCFSVLHTNLANEKLLLVY